MPNLGPQFYPKLVQIASELGMKPEDILAIMVSESGIDPSNYLGRSQKKDPDSENRGGGLVGFMPETLKNLGFRGKMSDFVALPGQDQLDYVKKLISSRSVPLTSAAQYYVANFCQ